MNNIIAFPHMSYYYIPIKYVIKKITQSEVLIPAPNSKETISLGSKYSPNDVCMPFKYNLGNYLNALNRGANILIQAGGGCRYGYYAELQEQILKDLGYNFKFINLIKDNHISIIKLYKEAKKINNKLTIFKYLYYLIQGILIIIYMDKMHKYIRENQAKSLEPNRFKSIFLELKKKYSKDELSIIKINKIYQYYKKKILSIKLNENKKTTKILLIGELYTLMDEAANNYLENNLIAGGSIIYRYTDLTYLLLKKKFNRHKILNKSKKYIKYTLGADSVESIYHAIKHCPEGIDGIIHIKSYSCVPEINAIPILNQISNDYQVPIIYLSFDGENNIANIDTKIEAFYDMIKAKKEKK